MKRSTTKEAKRLLLAHTCRECYNYNALFITASVIDTKDGIPLNDKENRRIFLESLRPVLVERKCELQIDFEKGNNKPKVSIPSSGWCDNWLNKNGDPDK